MKTIGFKPENFDLLVEQLTRPDDPPKLTTTRAGDKTKRFHVGERVEARCNKDHRAVECEVTSLTPKLMMEMTDADARADGFSDKDELWNALRAVNKGRHVGAAQPMTIIGLRVVGPERDTRFEAFTDHQIFCLRDGLEHLPALCGDSARLYDALCVDYKRRKPGVQA